jgi:hypothetical protein
MIYTATVYLAPVKVLVCGSRYWMDQKAIDRELRKLPPGTIIVHGGAQGADNIAGYVAELLGFEVRVYPALAHGRTWPSAGPLRNQEMLDVENSPSEPIDKALAFHKDPGLGKGTKDMADRLKKAGIPLEIFAA